MAHYVAELKTELTECKVRMQLAAEAANNFKALISTHDKFKNDSTIQTGDVSRWIDDTLRFYMSYNFSYTYSPNFVEYMGAFYVEFKAHVVSDSRIIIKPKDGMGIVADIRIEKTAKDDTLPELDRWGKIGKTSDGFSTIRMGVMTAIIIGII